MIERKILLVENYEDSRQLLTVYLSRERYAVRATGDGLSALEMAVTFCPDIIITEFLLPSLNGMQLIERLKANPITKNSPVIVATAETDPVKLANLLGAGAAQILLKPVSLVTLGDLIRNYFKGDTTLVRRGGQPLRLQSSRPSFL